MEVFNPLEPVTIQKFGPEDALQRIMLLVPHDAPVEPFLKAYPEYEEACPSKGALRELAESQRDVGALELARVLKDEILKTREKTQVILCIGNTPRTIIDLNRIKNDVPKEEANSIWYNFEFDDHPDLYAELADIHERGINIIRNSVKNMLIGGDILIDLHTMGSYTPPIHLRPNPNNLQEIVKLWRKKVYHEGLRKIDFITLIDDKDGRKPISMANEHLTNSIEAQLYFQGYPYERNKPYAGRSFLLSCEVALEAAKRGIANTVIDIPKHEIGIVPQKGGMKAFDLCKIHLGKAGIVTLAYAILNGILDFNAAQNSHAT